MVSLDVIKLIIFFVIFLLFSIFAITLSDTYFCDILIILSRFSLFALFERQGKIFGKSRSKLIVGVQSALYSFEMGRLRPLEGGKSCHNLAVSVMHIRLLSGHTTYKNWETLNEEQL